MIKPREIHRISDALNVSEKQIEKDYVITWILWGIALDELLCEILAFKGGTVLKKVYFDDYRYSEDLDFTLLDEQIGNDEIVSQFNAVFNNIASESGIEFQITKERSHKASGSLSFFTDYMAPLEGKMGSRDIKVDVTRNEVLVYDLKCLPIFLNYSDLEDQDFKIQCYSLSEVLIEKMTAVMGRTIPRDIYDLWYLFEHEELDMADHIGGFESKARDKGHDPSEFRTKLEKSMGKYESAWKKSLGTQIQELPEFRQVIRELNQHLRKYY